MIKKVETERELVKHEEVYKTVWEEKNYVDEYPDEGEKFLILSPEGEVVGCFEIFPFEKNGPLDSIYPFSRLEEISSNEKNVFEIEKVAILSPYRGGNFVTKMIEFYIKYAIENKKEYVIALINKRFYRYIKDRMGIPLVNVESRLKGSYDYEKTLKPIIVDIQRTIEKYERGQLNFRSIM
ncbi:hypothetical protein J2S74_000195 [Evansella vedderi]|uniref:N-acetyltransferase domain-containing protein n=1 Tax=Evansella vedderi TaxID=38282 RepID=A0ABT9ZNL2_9BACI|nr:GNAT family N-acetyltransferase [Evansella vedderi]MDQ0252823.1 hypothetical protein [Evansella vedderi]